jgi:hypothetical protein
MSYNIDGKVANQECVLRLSGKVPCGKCRKSLQMPEKVIIKTFTQELSCASYIGMPFYIYETKSGTAVVYCSEYCRNKHNHRFSK